MDKFNAPDGTHWHAVDDVRRASKASLVDHTLTPHATPTRMLHVATPRAEVGRWTREEIVRAHDDMHRRINAEKIERAMQTSDAGRAL